MTSTAVRQYTVLFVLGTIGVVTAVLPADLASKAAVNSSDTNDAVDKPALLIPFGKFEATDQTENFANYRSSLNVEFKGFSAKHLKGKVQHEFSRINSTTYAHAFWIVDTPYKQNLPFELGREYPHSYNGTAFKYRYYQEPSQLGLHAVFHVPADNPLPIEHLYTSSSEGFILTYKIGDMIAKRSYKRV
ncbi:secretory-abundant heat soluble protein 1-like isoform X2 [Paramacrobiotus metropolitanus]|uniref:secretory-abundant heat soluble protein 1-like isoform X2 n=1 Tax=Paramacrobiotus metropolitanus TaxID=2943436 RepID=UPI002445A210|nr:secretory-abundant heat soluble protein 1-like isoform X2 [Paramacrobiotus metropolitanus]